MARPAALDEAGSAPRPAAPTAEPPAAAMSEAMPAASPTMAPRRVEDAAASPATLAARPADTVPPAAGSADAVGFRINFALDSALIPAAYEGYIDRVGALMQQEPALALRVEGHTDARGSDHYNDELSERRAIAVARHLVLRHGIEPERLRIAGKGKSEPLMEDRYDPRNRRVQFLRVQ
jgi:outer membrane protein OmpA-like peptidoglycan-associated protein